MSIRARLTAWYLGISLASFAFLGCGLYFELVVERDADRRAGRPSDSVRQEIFDILTLYGLPVILITIVGGWWLTRSTLAPVTELIGTAEKITLHNLSARLPDHRRPDELGRLTEVFNQMLARLDASLGQVREFTLHASHELKTPLTIMRGELETALRRPDCPPPQREFLANLLDEVQRLAKIVDGLVLLSKADAGQLVLHKDAVSFDELLRDSFADTQVLAQPFGITVSLSRCDPVVVQGDRHRLRQLLLNLSDNAIKYNQPAGRVEMSLARDGDAIELKIRNTGPGIPPEKLPRVFDRFFRCDPSHSSEIEGCGLGLTIAQWIVLAHGGAIDVTSEPGQLTTFTVRLPLGKEDAVSAAA